MQVGRESPQKDHSPHRVRSTGQGLYYSFTVVSPILTAKPQDRAPVRRVKKEQQTRNG